MDLMSGGAASRAGVERPGLLVRSVVIREGNPFGLVMVQQQDGSSCDDHEMRAGAGGAGATGGAAHTRDSSDSDLTTWTTQQQMMLMSSGSSNLDPPERHAGGFAVHPAEVRLKLNLGAGLGILDNGDDPAAMHPPKDSLYSLRRNRKRSLRLGEESSPQSPGALQIDAHDDPEAEEIKNLVTESCACPRCFKVFQSGRSLFRHMKKKQCDPEEQEQRNREWSRILGQARKKHCPDSNLPSTGSSEPDEDESNSKSAIARKNSIIRKRCSVDSSDNESIEATYVAAAAAALAGKKIMTGRRSNRSRSSSQRNPHQDHEEQQQQQLQLQQHHPKPKQLLTDIKDEKDMANCLVMLACDKNNAASCASAANSRDDDPRPQQQNRQDPEVSAEVDWQDLTKKLAGPGARRTGTAPGSIAAPPKYSCATCKRVFKSHQALGGHRASHKKVKGCFARTSSSSSSKATLTTAEEGDDHAPDDEEQDEEEEGDQEQEQEQEQDDRAGGVAQLLAPSPLPSSSIQFQRACSSSRSSGGHECSVCHRVFATGQALGGHKRCHWVASGTTTTTTTTTAIATTATNTTTTCTDLGAGAALSQSGQPQEDDPRNSMMLLNFDLNLPPPRDEELENSGTGTRFTGPLGTGTGGAGEASASCDTGNSNSTSTSIHARAWRAVAADYCFNNTRSIIRNQSNSD